MQSSWYHQPGRVGDKGAAGAHGSGQGGASHQLEETQMPEVGNEFGVEDVGGHDGGYGDGPGCGGGLGDEVVDDGGQGEALC